MTLFPPKNRHFPPFFSWPILGGGQPGPRAENREWGQGEARWHLPRAMMSTMPKEERTSLQSELAAALAAGKSCAEWASANGVTERTAQRWASDSEVRAVVEAYRRGNLLIHPRCSRLKDAFGT